MGGEFYIRIEDTDQTRFNPKALEYIKNSLEWCGIYPDHSPWNPRPNIGEYFQSKREYSTYIKYLLDNNFAYFAFDTAEELDAKKIPYIAKNRHLFKNSISLSKEETEHLLSINTPYTIRIKVIENQEIILNDLIRGEIKFNTNDIDDKVLVKSNGIPTYHLAHVVDDHLMETSHVIRGDEWIPSAPIHLILWKAFGWNTPQYAHLSLILNPDGKGKLSKRTAFKNGFEIFPLECSDTDEKGNIVSFKGFKGLGYESIAYINFIALLGFNFGKDILTIKEMIENFDLTKVSKSPAIFDPIKSVFINREHMLKLSNQELWNSIVSPDIEIYDDHQKYEIINLAKERANFVDELKITINMFFQHYKTKEISEETKYKIQSFFNNNLYKYEDIKNWIELNHINKKELREVVCGGLSGPELPKFIEIIGLKEFKKRFEKYL